MGSVRILCFFIMKNNSKEEIAIYIDGSNFYFSIKNKFNCKIDIKKFCKKLVKGNNLVKINYYIAPIEQFSNPKMYAKQQSFFEILRKIDKFKIIFGRLEKRKRKGIVYYVEKATDINLALDLVLDAQKGIYDKAFLISNDGDFSGAVSSAINFKKKVIYIAIGSNKALSHHLEKVATSTIKINKDFISDIILKKAT